MSSTFPTQDQIRLIATDLDGTLLDSQGYVSSRTRQALAAARAVGIWILPVTARPPRSVSDVAAQADFAGLGICSNGALVWDFDSLSVQRIYPLEKGVTRQAVLALRQALPGVVFSFERGEDYCCEPGYAALRQWPPTPGEIIDDALEICDDPVTKVCVRHPTRPLEELTALVAEHFGDDGVVGHSGWGPAEVTARGVSKGSILARLCEEGDLQADQVMAFGDMPNDAPMLTWAGWGVAMANAHPAALDAARMRTATNDEDGVAQVIERLLEL